MSGISQVMLSSHFTEVVATLITVLMGVIAKHKHNKLNEKKKENDLLKDNVYQAKIQRIKEIYDLQRFSVMQLHLKELFSETPIDRFTLMFLINGKINFNSVTVLFDQDNYPDSEVGGISPYSQFQIDEPYRVAIRQVEANGWLYREGPDFGMGKIDEFMELELIKASCWNYVTRIAMDQFNDVVIFSSATTQKKYLTRREQNKVRLLVEGQVIPQIRPILRTPDPAIDGIIIKSLGLDGTEKK